jgi:hypothetical protein
MLENKKDLYMNKTEDLLLWNEIAEIFKGSEASTSDRIQQEAVTRKARIERAFTRCAETEFSGRDRQIFDLMWLGKELETLNEELMDDLHLELRELAAEEHDKNVHLTYGHYSLMRSLRLISFYYCFGSKGNGRLTDKSEALLLEVLWERTKYKNDIAVTRTSTWWMTGSENHDLNTNVCNLITSRIFMDEEEYKERIFPNLGFGDGIAYGEGGDFTRPEAAILQAGKADLSDGKSYTAEDHYAAWKQYFLAYFAERAKRGFFLENGACGYMKWTLNFILGLYNFCGDENLRNQIRMFQDLVWADWAVQQLGGVRGGPKTRHHYEAGGYDSMSDMARFYAGGNGKSTFIYVQQLLSDYHWSKVIWELVFDVKSIENYSYISRGLGEEQPLFPRPLGCERTMLCDVESRIVKYSYVTPDYILGTQMDHPLALFSHLGIAGRWQGLVTSDPDVRITTVALDTAPGTVKEGKEYSLELMFSSVQHENVLITQQSRRWMQANPDWYPAYDNRYNRPFGIYIGKSWDQVIEKNGWVFACKDNTYAAIRVIQLKTDDDPLAWAKGTDTFKNQIVLREDSYSWNGDNTIISCNNRFSPVIIEMGNKAEYQTFANFIQRIQDNPLQLYKTVVTGETGVIIVYTGCSKGAKEIVYNAANPHDAAKIGGEYIDYSYPKVFDSPQIQSDYDSGVVILQSTTETEMLDFTAQLEN